MRNVWLSLGLVVVWALVGWTQCSEIPYTVGGTTVTLRFCGNLTVSGGTCSQVASNVVRCSVSEGTTGTVNLSAQCTPTGTVTISATSIPAGWSSFTPVSGSGSVSAQYRFTVPAGSAGRRVELKFKAWTAGVGGELELRLVLDVVRAVTPPPPTEPTVPPSYGPFTGTTDASGWFEVQIPTLPNMSVTGKLTECTVRPLPHTPVSVTLVPKPGTTIRSGGDIGAVRVSSAGYIETEIVQLTLASSMDMFGRTYTTADVGTVCLRPTTVPVTPPPVTPTGPITGKTDGEGKFTTTLSPGTTVTGRLTECTVKPLPNQEFTLTPVPKGETVAVGDVGGFAFTVPGYQETTVTKFSTFSLLGLTSYYIGDVCLPPPCTLIVRGKVDDGAPHGAPAYPISKSKVWLFVLEEGDRLPLDPLSVLARRPTAETSTNHTNERSFDGTEFRVVEEAKYEFRLRWTKPCPPRVVIVSLLWYDERDLMAVSSENLVGGRLVPVYLAKVIIPSGDPYLPHYGTAGAAWQKTGLNDYAATVDFSYGRDPLARDSAEVIGIGRARRDTSEEWDRKSVDADVFMRNCAHHYFYGYKAMRYFERLAGQIGVGLKPVAVSMFVADGPRDPRTSCSGGDVTFGGLAGSPRVTADAQVFIGRLDSIDPQWGGNKPDNSIWHEMGHYWWLQIYGSFWPMSAADPNHGGYRNSSTVDSLGEGFAEFTSMLIAEYFGDPRPFMYAVSGNNHNLEVDIQLWGPPADREEFAIAGLLWDLHDGGNIEFKPLGTISTVIETADHVSLSDVQIFAIFVEEKPRTLKAVHDALMDIPPYGGTDTDLDGVPDVRELFVAHGAFEDTAPTNQRWDGGAEIIGFGGRAGRWNSPPLPQAYLRIRLVDVAGHAVSLDEATMHVDMRFADPFRYYDYQDVRPLASDRVYFVMPPPFYQVTASITVEGPGVGRSAPLEITAEEYWDLFRQAGEAGWDHVLEHTFVLGG